jgi:hypothetical protein
VGLGVQLRAAVPVGGGGGGVGGHWVNC